MFGIKLKRTQSKEMFDFTEKAVIKISCQKMIDFLQKKSEREKLNDNEKLALSKLNNVVEKVNK